MPNNPQTPAAAIKVAVACLMLLPIGASAQESPVPNLTIQDVWITGHGAFWRVQCDQTVDGPATFSDVKTGAPVLVVPRGMHLRATCDKPEVLIAPGSDLKLESR